MASWFSTWFGSAQPSTSVLPLHEEKKADSFHLLSIYPWQGIGPVTMDVCFLANLGKAVQSAFSGTYGGVLIHGLSAGIAMYSQQAASLRQEVWNLGGIRQEFEEERTIFERISGVFQQRLAIFDSSLGRLDGSVGDLRDINSAMEELMGRNLNTVVRMENATDRLERHVRELAAQVRALEAVQTPTRNPNQQTTEVEELEQQIDVLMTQLQTLRQRQTPTRNPNQQRLAHKG